MTNKYDRRTFLAMAGAVASGPMAPAVVEPPRRNPLLLPETPFRTEREYKDWLVEFEWAVMMQPCRSQE